MAKIKQIELKECKICINSVLFDNVLYCKLKMIDYGCFSEYAKVKKCDCIWFKLSNN